VRVRGRASCRAATPAPAAASETRAPTRGPPRASPPGVITSELGLITRERDARRRLGCHGARHVRYARPRLVRAPSTRGVGGALCARYAQHAGGWCASPVRTVRRAPGRTCQLRSPPRAAGGGSTRALRASPSTPPLTEAGHQETRRVLCGVRRKLSDPPHRTAAPPPHRRATAPHRTCKARDVLGPGHRPAASLEGPTRKEKPGLDRRPSSK